MDIFCQWQQSSCLQWQHSPCPKGMTKQGHRCLSDNRCRHRRNNCCAPCNALVSLHRLGRKNRLCRARRPSPAKHIDSPPYPLELSGYGSTSGPFPADFSACFSNRLSFSFHSVNYRNIFQFLGIAHHHHSNHGLCCCSPAIPLNLITLLAQECCTV